MSEWFSARLWPGVTEKIDNRYEGTFGQLKGRPQRHRGAVGCGDPGGDRMITTAAKEIAMGNTDLSQRTEEQASSLQETASSMDGTDPRR